MKRGRYLFLVLCFFLIGCGSTEEERKPENLWEITATRAVSLKPTPSPLPETVATSTPVIREEKPTSTVFVTPGGATVTPDLTATPIVSTSTPTPIISPSGSEVLNLGVEAYEDEKGRTVYEAATSFFDENGLLCVGLKAVGKRDSELFETEKTYYLPNATIYRENELVSKEGLKVLFQGHVVKEKHKTNVYEPIVYETIGKHVWTTGGRLVETEELLGADQATKFVCTPEDGYIPVKEGEILRMTYHFSWFSQVGGIVFLDEQNHVVQAYSFGATTKMKTQEIQVPKNAVKMHLSMYVNQTYRIERKTELVGADLSTITEETYVEQSMRKMQELSKSTAGGYSLDKAYITFVLDDCRPDMDRVADIFQEYEIPLCIAAVHENLLFPASRGEETRQQVCERVVAAGGEVLAHDGEVITQETLRDYCELTEQFYEDKWVLEQKGFDVNGIVLAGGSGQIIGHPVTDTFAKTFYQYSDLYGNEDAGEPYYHRRIWLGNCHESYKGIIENAVKEKTWLVLYFHDLNEVNAEKLREILAFVSALDEKEAETVTYKTLYDKMW